MATAPTAVQQVRLLTGDVSLQVPYLADSTYEWLLETYTNNTLDAAVEALEMIINQISLAPQSISTDAAKEVAPLVANLELRLKSLKVRKNTVKTGFPMIIKSDRSNWDDFDSLFPKGK